MIQRLCNAPHKPDPLKAGGGYARIFGPDGRPLAEPLDPAAEGIVYADINLSMISIAKAAADPAGHYSRRDVIRLWLNRESAPRVVCVIRSVQYWGACGEKELEFYQSKVHPTSLKGMDYLAKNGPEANCYKSRTMDQLYEKGQQHDRTFGLSFFKTMGDMEARVEHHATHLRIFHALLKMAEVRGRSGPALVA